MSEKGVDLSQIEGAPNAAAGLDRGQNRAGWPDIIDTESGSRAGAGGACMRAMVLTAPGTPLQMQERADPLPGEGQIRVKISACGVCRTDLHVVDAELPGIKYPIIPGHEIVGRVDLVCSTVTTHRIGDRVGIPWLGYSCGVCRFLQE